MTGESGLRDLQGWLQAVICDPRGVAAAVASEEARRWLTVAPDGLDHIVRPSDALTAEQRLGLYARSYRVRLLECMRELHPALHHALGRSLFDDFTLDYLQTHPPTSPTLFELDHDFADHLAAHQPQLSDDEEPWPSFLVDLARLERLFLEVYDGPGSETLDTTPSTPPAGPARDWAEWTMSAMPCLRLLASPYPVGRYLLAVRAGEQPALPLPQACLLVLTRRDYTVVLHELAADTYRLLEELVTGASLGAAAAAAGMQPADAWQAVRDWSAQGYFQTIGTPASQRNQRMRRSTTPA
jgi:Putative DNA-binding domain